MKAFLAIMVCPPEWAGGYLNQYVPLAIKIAKGVKFILDAMYLSTFYTRLDECNITRSVHPAFCKCFTGKVRLIGSEASRIL